MQAVNVLILVWLLSRLFWRPVAAAIAERQASTKATLDAAKAAQAKADAALAKVSEDRAGLAAERQALLAEAMSRAEAETKAKLAEAQAKAETVLAAAQTSIKRDSEAARKANAAQASTLSVEIAGKLLSRLPPSAVRDAWLSLLIKAIDGMATSERDALVASTAEIEIITAAALSAAEKAAIKKAVIAALGGTPRLKFVTDPDLIAGLELRSAHFVLHNSWRADLATISREMNDAIR
nr:ATP synthase F0 subunit B [Marinicella sp. W31]MDC2879128.1 ATP synthase F0 subunit B [Marinicella sp. W31]